MIHHLSKPFAANICFTGYNYTDNFTADVEQQTTKVCVEFSCSVFWLMHAVISNKCMLILSTMSLHIHVESPKGMQFALKYEICELKRI